MSDDAQVRVTMVTRVPHNEHLGDQEAGEVAHVTEWWMEPQLLYFSVKV